MKKIIMSLTIIAAVAAVVAGGTYAYFSDTEVSGSNTFTAGTLEINIDDDATWSEGFKLDDLKPCYTDYINFRINNDGNNPVDITKKLIFDILTEGQRENGINEPECEAYGGTWNGDTCDGGTAVNNIEDKIIYDLSVGVYDLEDNKIWDQVIYTGDEGKTIGEIYDDADVYLGMIPVDHYMMVTQSYHMDCDAGNKYQSDQLAFTITVEGKQLTGDVVLENKSGAPDWDLLLEDGYKGNLSYEVKAPTFKFDFDGKVEAPGTYVLAAGENPGAGYDWNVDTYLGEVTTAGDGTFSFSGDVELSGDMKDAKIWFMPKATWNGGNITWANMNDFLWETGLIWYEDTDF